MAKFQIDGFTCYSERDYFETGCDPDSGRNWFEDREYKSDNIEDLLNVIAYDLGVQPSFTRGPHGLAEEARPRCQL